MSFAQPPDALGEMSAQVRSAIDHADRLHEQIARAETEMLDGSRRKALRDLREVSRDLSELLSDVRRQRLALRDARPELERLPDADQRLRELEHDMDTAGERAARARQTAAEALNLYQSIAAEQLTRIATLLLPLTVVSGFFGMNFGWMVDHIDSAAAFFAFGIGGLAAAVAAAWLYLRQTGA